MKKLFALLAVVLAVVSCQKDAGLDVNVGGEQLVNITVALPEATRAASGTGFDLTTLGTDFELRYILEIYVDGNTTDCIRKELFTTATENVVFPVRLVPKRNYRVVAWADIVPAVDNRDVEGDFDYDHYYETSYGLDAVTIIDNKWNAMDEYRDAYTAYQVVNNFTANTAINLTLVRPFAKLRVVSTDIKNIEDLGYSLKDVVVEYNVDLKREFNALYGTANAASYKSHTFDFYTTTPYDDKDNKDSRTLFADYIFVKNIEEQDAVQFTMSVYAQDGLLKNTTFNTDIALRANTLTTIIGEVLTEGGNVQIKIDGELNEDQAKDYTVVSSASHLLNAINAGGEYMLGNDIIVTEADAAEAEGIVTRAAGEANEANEPKTTTINLNGKTITIINKSNKPLVTVPAGNTLTFTDNTNTGSIVLAEDSTESFIKNEGTVILEAGEINNHEDNNVPVIDGKIVIDGATVNDNEVEESNKLDNNEKWFADVIKNGGTVILSDDMSFTKIIEVTAKKPVVIDGNGKTITSSAGRAINVDGATADVTIKNLNIVASGERAINVINNSKKVTIENVTATAANYTVNVAGSAPNATVVINNSDLTGLNTVNIAADNTTVTITNTKITTDDKNDAENYGAISIYNGTNSYVTVNGGEIVVKGDSVAAGVSTDYSVVTFNDTIGATNDDVVYYNFEVNYGNNAYTFTSLNDALDRAIQDKKEVTVVRSFSVSEPLVIEEGKIATINLNGKTITGEFASGEAIIKNNGTLTIVGGTIENTLVNGGAAIDNTGELVLQGIEIKGAPIGETGYPNYAVYSSGKLIINNDTQITSDRGVLYMRNGADVTINGGEFVVTDEIGTRVLTAHVIYAYGSSSKLTINDGRFEMNIGNGGGTSVICPAGATIKVYGGDFYHKPVADVQSGCFQNYMGYGAPVDVYGGTFNDNTVTKSGNLADGYKAIEVSNGTFMVVKNEVTYCDEVITNQEGVRYEGDWFETGYMENALWFNNYIFGGDAAIKVNNKTYGAIVMQNCSGNFKDDVITINNDNNSVMILENLNLTIAEGKKLIKSANTIYQVFMVNITINGEEMTNETIAKYLENVGWYQVVEEI